MEEVIIDFKLNSKQPVISGSFYTALSRVKRGDNFYLRRFQPEFIKANPAVETKLKNMEVFAPYSFKKVYLDNVIFETPEEVKIGYININSLYQGSSDILLNGDKNLLKLDILCVADTRLTEADSATELERRLSNWTIIERVDADDGQKHMGLLLLTSKSSLYEAQLSSSNIVVAIECAMSKETEFLQMIKLRCFNMKIGFFYIRETPTVQQIEVHLEPFFLKTDLVMGDMNLDPRREEDLKKLMKLCGLRRVRVLNENTTNRFNQLDHIFIRADLSQLTFSTSFINHTSDHRTITTRIPLKQQSFSQSFKEDWHFDRDHWTRKRRKVVSRVEKGVICDFTLASTIDEYLELLRVHNLKRVFIFDTEFFESLCNMQSLPAKYKDHQLIKSDTVFIPVMSEINGYFDTSALMKWTGDTLEIFLPCQRLEKNNPEKKVKKLFQNYCRELFGSFSSKPPKIRTSMVFCHQTHEKESEWVFLLSFLKACLMSGVFDENSFDPRRELLRMEKELNCRKVFPPPAVTKKRKTVDASDSQSKRHKVTRSEGTKRNANPAEEDQSSSKKKRVQSSQTSSSNRRRRFLNQDGVTCWLNSTLQVVLHFNTFLFILKLSNFRVSFPAWTTQSLCHNQEVTSMNSCCT